MLRWQFRLALVLVAELSAEYLLARRMRISGSHCSFTSWRQNPTQFLGTHLLLSSINRLQRLNVSKFGRPSSFRIRGVVAALFASSSHSVVLLPFCCCFVCIYLIVDRIKWEHSFFLPSSPLRQPLPPVLLLHVSNIYNLRYSSFAVCCKYVIESIFGPNNQFKYATANVWRCFIRPLWLISCILYLLFLFRYLKVISKDVYLLGRQTP